jgi:hypothetical protein
MLMVSQQEAVPPLVSLNFPCLDPQPRLLLCLLELGYTASPRHSRAFWPASFGTIALCRPKLQQVEVHATRNSSLKASPQSKSSAALRHAQASLLSCSMLGKSCLLSPGLGRKPQASRLPAPLQRPPANPNGRPQPFRPRQHPLCPGSTWQRSYGGACSSQREQQRCGSWSAGKGARAGGL